jgi:hypothetical protein
MGLGVLVVLLIGDDGGQDWRSSGSVRSSSWCVKSTGLFCVFDGFRGSFWNSRGCV